jgi:DNA-binding winged helix-turn-helix (wHTH) protein
VDTEHGINTAIRKIRQVLGDDPENPRFVQTVTGKGYRFIAPIAAADPSLSGDRSRLSPTESNPLEIGGPVANGSQRIAAQRHDAGERSQLAPHPLAHRLRSGGCPRLHCHKSGWARFGSSIPGPLRQT